MIKTLKNISKEDQLVMTINGKETVKAGATFETAKAEELLRNYKYLFVEVNDDEIENEKKEKKVEKKEIEENDEGKPVKKKFTK